MGSPASLLDKAIEDVRARLADFAKQYQAGDIGLDEWRAATTGELKTLHIMAALAGSGGDDLDASQRQTVGAQLGGQFGYLNRLTTQLATGEQAPDARFLARVGMYADAARTTFAGAERGQAQADGALWERRVLGETEHCPECLEYAARGWQPVGSLPLPGEDSSCMVNCACEMEYSSAAEKPAEDAEEGDEAPAEEGQPAEESPPPEEEEQPPSPDELQADAILDAVEAFLENGPAQSAGNPVPDDVAKARHIKGIANRIGEISPEAARIVAEKLGLTGTSRAAVKRELIAYLEQGSADFYSPDQPRGQPGNAGQWTAGGAGGAPADATGDHPHDAESRATAILAAVKDAPRQVLDKAARYVKAKYARMEQRYGRAGALAVLGASVALTPIPLPGTSFLPVALAEAYKAIKGKLAGGPAPSASFAGGAGLHDMAHGVRGLIEGLYLACGEEPPDVSNAKILRALRAQLDRHQPLA